MKIEIGRSTKEQNEELKNWYEKIDSEQKELLEFKFDEDTFFSLKVNGVVVGIMSVLEQPKEYTDLRRFVLHNHRSAGLADMMLDYLIDEGKKMVLKG